MEIKGFNAGYVILYLEILQVEEGIETGMNHPELLPFKENKTSINLHCVKCGKYKSKKSRSKLCTACLFGKDFKKSYIRA